ncbi:MetS family NSS transporter small subunit [Rubrobacter indicoceani]|uniref:MetS family NSS transporter small subunit n=1 Tax=Rubrobacter indicoceani TaxID=2051957 RepID=UPI000E5C4812|nr:MetS family NSS transporter small subunit [Rubrobacter indicoceani]
MNTGALVMLIIGIVGLWGGLIVSIMNYLRASREEARTDNTTAGRGPEVDRS